jgi:hypothetical protein
MGTSTIDSNIVVIISGMDKYAPPDHSPHPGPARSPRSTPGSAARQPSPQPPVSSQHAMMSGQHAMSTGPPGQHHAMINKQPVSSSQQAMSSHAMSTLAASHQTMTNLLSSRLGKQGYIFTFTISPNFQCLLM